MYLGSCPAVVGRGLFLLPSQAGARDDRGGRRTGDCKSRIRSSRWVRTRLWRCLNFLELHRHCGDAALDSGKAVDLVKNAKGALVNVGRLSVRRGVLGVRSATVHTAKFDTCGTSGRKQPRALPETGKSSGGLVFITKVKCTADWFDGHNTVNENVREYEDRFRGRNVASEVSAELDGSLFRAGGLRKRARSGITEGKMAASSDPDDCR